MKDIEELERQIEYLKRNRNQQEIFIIISLISQTLAIVGVIYTFKYHRKIAVVSFYNWFLRISFSIIILKILQNDIEDIRCYQAIYNCGLSRVAPSNSCFLYIFTWLVRQLVTYTTMVVIVYYLFTLSTLT